MSSDALLMNIFCTPGVTESTAVQAMLGVEVNEAPIFGWKARVPLAGGRFDRTEVDMRWGGLMLEAKLTEADFQSCERVALESYCDFETVFQTDLLPAVMIPHGRRREAAEFPESYSQEEVTISGEEWLPALFEDSRDVVAGYASYQLIRNVLGAYAQGLSFCVVHDERRPDLRESWFRVMAAVRSAEVRVRLKVLTWQELVPLLSDELQEFLDLKYGIVAPGRAASPIAGLEDFG